MQASGNNYCKVFIDWDIENNGGVETLNFAFAEIFQFFNSLSGATPAVQDQES